MRSRQQHLQAQERIATRRQREDEAPRLRHAVPRLRSLHFQIDSGDTKYLWRIMLESAPALFCVPCTEPACRDGGHDVTGSVMRALMSGAERFEGDHDCGGDVRQSSCRLTLNYVGIATYDPR